MENKVYYGEYSLKHWIDLILKGNIQLPPYQRYFVWDSKKSVALVESFSKKHFVPPVIIGAFTKDGKTSNLILDGQQRLTTVLLSYLGIFPNIDHFKTQIEKTPDENDSLPDEDSEDTTLGWTFRELTGDETHEGKGKNKKIILETLKNEIENKYYQKKDFGKDNSFFYDTYLGFSYLIPCEKDEKSQQKYFSSVFRNINLQGVRLSIQESREALYYLDNSKIDFFKPRFAEKIKVNNEKIDFVRYLSLASEYFKLKSEYSVAKGYRYKMEDYYTKFIDEVINDNVDGFFSQFSSVFKKNSYQTDLQKLEKIIQDLNIPKQMNSIIEADVIYLGLIYQLLFEKREIDNERKKELNEELQRVITEFQKNDYHKKTPAALKYLRERIAKSIEVYKKYEK